MVTHSTKDRYKEVSEVLRDLNSSFNSAPLNRQPINNNHMPDQQEPSNSPKSGGFSKDSFFTPPPSSPENPVSQTPPQTSQEQQPSSPPQASGFSKDSFFAPVPPKQEPVNYQTPPEQEYPPIPPQQQYPQQQYNQYPTNPPSPTPPSQVPTYVVPGIQPIPPTSPTGGGINKVLLIATAIGISAIGVMAGFLFTAKNPTPVNVIAKSPDTPQPLPPNPQPVIPNDSGAITLTNAKNEASSSGNLGKAIEIARGVPSTSSAYADAQSSINNWSNDWYKQNQAFTEVRRAYLGERWGAATDIAYNQIPRNAYWDSNAELTSMAKESKCKSSGDVWQNGQCSKSKVSDTFTCACGGIKLDVSKTDLTGTNGPDIGYAGCTVFCLPTSEAKFFCNADLGRAAYGQYSRTNRTGESMEFKGAKGTYICTQTLY